MINPAITAALIATAGEEETEETIIGKLRNGKATSSSSAMPLDIPDDKRSAIDRAIASGIVAKTADGRFYLIERAVADRQQSQGFMLLILLLICASVIASGVALVMSMKS